MSDRPKVIPRFVKVKSGFFNEPEMAGKILDTNEPFPEHLAACKGYTWKRIFVDSDSNFKWFQAVENQVINDYSIY